MQQGFDSTQSGSEQVFDIASNSEERISNLSQAFERLGEDSSELGVNFTSFAKKLILSVAKIDHILYKFNIYLALNGTHNFDLNSFDAISHLYHEERTKMIINELASDEDLDEVRAVTKENASCAIEESKAAYIGQEAYDSIVSEVTALEGKNAEILAKPKVEE